MKIARAPFGARRRSVVGFAGVFGMMAYLSPELALGFIGLPMIGMALLLAGSLFVRDVRAGRSVVWTLLMVVCLLVLGVAAGVLTILFLIWLFYSFPMGY